MIPSYAALLYLSLMVDSTLARDGERVVSEILRAQAPAETNQPAWRPDDADDVLVMVQAFYEATKDLQAKFEQTYWNPTYGEKKKTAGKLALEQPGKMVWDYDDEQGADYYSNGKTLWMVEHDTKQVIKTKVDNHPELGAALSFLFGGQDLRKKFEADYANADRVRRYGDADHYVLELRPKQRNPHYKGLVLVVHASTGRVDSFVVYNTDGASSLFELRRIKTNVGLSDKRFNFKAPAGYVESEE